MSKLPNALVQTDQYLFYKGGFEICVAARNTNPGEEAVQNQHIQRILYNQSIKPISNHFVDNLFVAQAKE